MVWLGARKRRRLWGILVDLLSSGFCSVGLASLDFSLILSLLDVQESWNIATEENIQLLLWVLLVFLLCIASLSCWTMHAWIKCNRGELGFKLQARAVIVFTLVGMIPAVVASGFAYLFFDYGVRAWYYNNIRPAFTRYIEETLKCADECSTAVMVSDAVHLANYLGTDSAQWTSEKISLGAELFSFSEILLISHREILASANPSSTSWTNYVTEDELYEINDKPVVFSKGQKDYTVQLLDSLSGIYLIAVRPPDDALEHNMLRFEEMHEHLNNLRTQMSALQIQFSLAFLLLFLVVLFVSVWLGVGFAKGIVGRLSELFAATKRVQDGDFDCRIEYKGKIMGEEIATVIKAFNQMVERLSEQRMQLENAYREINVRKVFVETVLSGVSSGVMALSPLKSVTLMNDRAMELLSCYELNKPIEEVLPEVLELVNMVKCKGDITIIRNHKLLTLSVNIERLKSQGLIITFDDISGLVEAQRKAAWSDVARRIAHEIKNPITPIYLAAERLGSKYAEQIVSGRETFLRYTDTIIKHVSNISCIVDEFAQFARMPSPTFKMCYISVIIRDISFLGQFGKAFVSYDLHFPEEEVLVFIDQEQISQVFVNIFKNACESINASPNADRGRIVVTVTKEEKSVLVEVRDNGIGFSEDIIGRLTEPYVTTREKGTGLGLAIVEKILQEHGASIGFRNSEEGGVVRITFLK
ncbi:sensor histidine kinase NtrY-like [Anaplasma phagocytophilum]|nr:ATP-binding protein [Anaplasma phagocytophilum]AGR81121.1 ATPase [Anaplasma phagocytophilum str. Dog2]KJZ98962.1 HAMP domain protein [Anaplasma phagocytophilum str. CR1007]AGR79866.1 ATPase [Anaplasma phagocytophilum str. JM]EOA61729.1 nitrogen regulation protein [Anaplasma phagocytophilum str. HGE1]KJV59819.1 HAMP domain protein [Anaplasma phagocytophilum str. Webster]